jgi:esterase/lipase superfamily enzyme
VATPNLLHARDPAGVFESCPADCQTADAPVIYATDRANLAGAGEAPNYGHGRANCLVFGTATVRLNPNPTWTELIRESTSAKRSRRYALALGDVHEMGQIRTRREQPLMTETGVVHTKASAAEAIEDATHRGALQELLSKRLAETSHKDVYVYIHGANNAFEDGIFRAAEVWHFMGRVGVPVAYTWPSGLGGIRGYAYDRESGEFTVSHLRRFIKTVAECPDVERVHLIAHSRGTDVTLTALRELHIAYRARDKSTQHELKLENLVLAAPDVDEEIFMQRFVAEGVLRTARRTTIYASEHDRAIELADLVFASRRRLGMLAVKDFSPKMRHALARMPNIQFIECKVTGSLIRHDYVFTHPAALSDLVLVLRDRRDPGDANGRPLQQPAEGLWELNDDYLKLTDARR